MRRALPAVAVLIATALLLTPHPWAADSNSKSRKLTIIAHRGGITPDYPENTLHAFRQALAHGANAIELDLRATKDGEIVIMHDTTVNRTTNGRGLTTDLTLAEVEKLDAGGGQQVPTYEDVLELVADSGVILLLDIKLNPGLDRERIVRLTKRHHALRKVIIGARSLEDLKLFQSLDSELDTLAFVRRRGDIEKFVDAGVDIVRIWPSWVRRDPGLIEWCHRRGVAAWVHGGGEEREVLEQLIALGVDGILLDSPTLIASLVAP